MAWGGVKTINLTVEWFGPYHVQGKLVDRDEKNSQKSIIDLSGPRGKKGGKRDNPQNSYSHHHEGPRMENSSLFLCWVASILVGIVEIGVVLNKRWERGDVFGGGVLVLNIQLETGGPPKNEETFGSRGCGRKDILVKNLNRGGGKGSKVQ